MRFSIRLIFALTTILALWLALYVHVPSFAIVVGWLLVAVGVTRQSWRTA
ncbi:hypothetical protein NG895_22510 [Aeoliella sp. ICT_H6.2]|uniref:Uncharacterized protein n=1 Tax=Aeoliella straminimaris TaxID=2954799 RepID=A0A9X2JJF3_9BACT|nr:hypothetical protein [Aeoliella straminimaris]MCO6046678.1 hypothetical protein [Aeoliella straminimaris]